jgi:hypothetical protein
VSIDRRLIISDNRGSCPCVPPLDLGRLLDRVYRTAPQTTTIQRVTAALANLRKKLLP